MQLRNIATESELDELIEASKTAPVLLFKHSNTCSVSSRASGQVDRFLSSEHATPFTAAVVVVILLLVLIIGLFDLLGIVQLNLADPKWFSPSTAMTGYVFVGALFWRRGALLVPEHPP